MPLNDSYVILQIYGLVPKFRTPISHPLKIFIKRTNRLSHFFR